MHRGTKLKLRNDKKERRKAKLIQKTQLRNYFGMVKNGK